MSTTQCKILKPFPYSLDGFNTKQAIAGTVVGIPHGLVAGLAAAGYVGPPDMGAPENKMLVGSPEHKARLAAELEKAQEHDAAAAALKAKEEAEEKAKAEAEAERKAKEDAEAAAQKPEDNVGSTPSGTAETPAEQAAVVIADNWRDLEWAELRSLASKVCSDPIKKKDEAIAAIEAELKRRAETAA